MLTQKFLKRIYKVEANWHPNSKQRCRLSKEALYWNNNTDQTALNLIMVAVWDLLANQAQPIYPNLEDMCWIGWVQDQFVFDWKSENWPG